MSHLDEKLAEAESIKREMAALLRELEAKATGRAPAPDEKPGYWRHHPAEWNRRHPASDQPPSAS